MAWRRLKKIWSSLTLRNKQLTFFAALIGTISFISLFSQYRLSLFLDEFQSNLDSYFTINRYLIELRTIRGQMNRFMREGSLESLQTVMSTKEGLTGILEMIDRQSNTSLETYFLIRALRNGQTVYLQKSMEAIELKQKEVDAYYLPYYYSDKVAEYLEGYTSQLLNICLSQGNQSYQILTRRVQESRNLVLFLLILISLLCIAFAILFTNSLTRPIQRLASAAGRMAAGDLETPPVPISSGDEVGVLENSFNRMRENIRRMFLDLEEKAELERKLHEEELRNVSMQRSLNEAQFLNLQSQINPHFLFNTLNLLSRSADFERAGQTAELVRSLANLFRYSFQGQRHSVTLSEEMEFVEEYLRIQTRRFGNRIRYIRNCRVEPETIRIPCFTLQPFVENALLHGLEPKEEGGVLRIKISRYKDRVRIRILDTGLGMDGQVLAGFKVRDSVPMGMEQSRSIGVKNVMARLRIFFDAQEDFRMYSKPGRGTLVWISFPPGGNGHVQSPDC